MSRKQKSKQMIAPQKGEFLVYQAEDGQIKLEVRLEQETLWLTQQAIAELLQTTVPNISMHIKNIFDEGELIPEATVKDFLIVHQEGQRTVKGAITHYNLDMIISIGYRVKSIIATRFRIWATARLKEYIVKGFTCEKLLERKRVGRLEPHRDNVSGLRRRAGRKPQDDNHATMGRETGCLYAI